MKQLYLIISLFVLIASCTSLPGGARLEIDNNIDNKSKETMAGFLTEVEAGHALNIFLIHGMGDTSQCFFDEVLANAPARIREAAQPICSYDSVPVILEKKYAIRGEAFSCPEASTCNIKKFGELFKKTISLDDQSINIYAYFWDKDAANFENIYTELDKGQGGVWINRALKNMVIVDGFSDAAFYMGEGGILVRDGVETALCMMVRDVIAVKTPSDACLWEELSNVGLLDFSLSKQKFAFMSFSLGSRMLFDGLGPRAQIDVLEKRAESILTNLELEQLTSPLPNRCGASSFGNLKDKFVQDPESRKELSKLAGKMQLANKVTQIHMAANQLPLLGLGNLQVRNSEQEARIRDGVYRLFVDPAASSTPADSSSVEKLVPENHETEIVESICSDGGFFNYLACQRNMQSRKAYCDNISTIKNVQTTQYVAFRDPNDLLGFKAADHLSATAKRAWNFYEVMHRNAAEYFWSAALPHKAHSREAAGKQSSKIIWCGANIAESGKLKPLSCY